jgi:glucosamine kinase
MEGPPALVDPANPDATIHVIIELCHRVAKQAGEVLPASGLWAGVAGAGTEPMRSTVEKALREAGIAEGVSAGADAEAAFSDAFGDADPGILLISGTGSIALGRGADGRMVRVGGWGGYLGDEGSGYAVGTAALRAIVRGRDRRGRPTSIQAPILKALGVDTAEGLIDWVASADKADVASFVPIVFREAEAGDAVASDIVDGAVDDLVSHVLTTIDRLGPWSVSPVVACAGGLISEGGPLHDPLTAALEASSCRLLGREVDGARGACRLAMGL